MPATRPNILLIVVDCLRSDRTFGPDRSAVTPNLQALADEGTLFSSLITANSMTIPCMTTMFSGMYPHNHGVRAMVGARVSDDIPLLAELLRDGGYNTYGEATGPLSPFYRLNRGFDEYETRDGVKSSLLNEWGDEFIGRFRDGAFEEPWFVYVHLWGVHRPRQVLPQYNTPEYGQTQYDRAISSYDARLGELFATIDRNNTVIMVTGDHGEKIPETALENRVEFLKKSLSGSGQQNSVWTKRRRKAIAAIREKWFSTTKTLHRAGILESPLASVTGHGYHVYDSLVRVPLVISGYAPAPAGGVIEQQVRQVDIMPTILEMAGLAELQPAAVDGRSLTGMMTGESYSNEPAYIETCQNSREPSSFYGVRAGGWKYAFDAADHSVPEELYDLSADPGETNNLATNNPQKAAEMRTLLVQHLQQQSEGGVALTDDLSEDEMAGLADHLKKLGYVE